MSRSTVLKVLVVLIVLIGAGLSTVQTRQVWAENQARARMLTARAATARAISEAARDGLRVPELAPYRRREDVLERARPPSSLPVLSSSVPAAFYDHQARAYRMLRRQVAQAVRTVTRQTRSQARADLYRLQTSIDRARRLDVDTKEATGAMSVEGRAYQRGSLPRDFRSVSAAAEKAVLHLDQQTENERRYVSQVLDSVHGERTGVVRRAEVEANQLQHPLSLLALLTARADGYRVDVATMLNAVYAATTAFDAAVKESHLRAEASLITRDYARTVPRKMVVVSTERQSADLYQDGNIIYSTPVTTGGPELPTDHGVFHIYEKLSPFTFHSPWPPSSPFYYPPTPVQFWMPFDRAEGLHDASWRTNFGPGSNLAATDLGTGNTILGTHGCVNLPFDAAQLVWNWAPLGTTVVVI